jgi:sugar phosphate isomerase/epimerase
MKFSRRSLLIGAPAGLLAAKPAGVRAGCQTNIWPADASDFENLAGVLATIKQLGFEGFETDFLNVRSQYQRAGAASERIRKTGLRFLGVHIGLKVNDPQTAIASQGLLQEVADGCKVLGAERLIVGGSSAIHPLALRAKADGLTRIAKYCKDIGVGCAYRTGDYDFQNDDAQISGLLSMTDPVVHFVLDSGGSIADFFKKNWRRIDGIHLPVEQAVEQAVEQGESDWKSLTKAIGASPWRGWLVVANDSGKGGEAGPAREALRRTFGV